MARKDSASSAAPKQPGRIARIRGVFDAAKVVDPMIGWWMLLAALAVMVVLVVVGILVHAWVYFLVISIPLAFLAAVVVMTRRAERAAYKSIEGKPGSAGMALSALRRGWYYDQQPVAVEATRATDLSSAAMVFRAVGRAGVVLIAEGPDARATRLVELERKKTARVAPGVPVTVLRVGEGDGEGVVVVRKLARTMTRLKPKLTKSEASAVNKRLKALGGSRPPLPAGVDPTKARMDRKAMRGR